MCLLLVVVVFFDVKWDYSRSGTTFDMSKDMIDKIDCPIIFNGMGIDISNQEENLDCLNKFIDFFEHIINKSNVIVSVRNDDSKKKILKYIGKSAIDKIWVIPDEGFFTTANDYYHPEIPCNKKIIAINTAKDRIKERWSNSDFDYTRYCSEMSLFINEYLTYEKDVHFVFVPHIPSDIDAAYDIIKNIDDPFARRNISVAPYLNGLNTNGDYVVDLYRKCDLVIGMRYHSNICAIAMGTPTLAIFTLQKHIELYNNLGYMNRLVSVNKCSFIKKIRNEVNKILNNRAYFANENIKLVKQLSNDILGYFGDINDMLS